MMQLTEEQRKELLAEIDYNRKNCFISDKTELIMQIAEAALIAKEEPCEDCGGSGIAEEPSDDGLGCGCCACCGTGKSGLYKAPPFAAPAINLADLVPDEATDSQFDGLSISKAEGWNACRAAILRNIKERSK